MYAPTDIFQGNPSAGTQLGTGEDISDDLFRLPDQENPCQGQAEGKKYLKK
jgi:hypothetical protein